MIMTEYTERDSLVDSFCQLSSGIRLCYRTYGREEGIPLLLIAGLGLQLTSWSSRLIRGLVNRGFKVIVFDNRDVGRSSTVEASPPSFFKQLFRLTAGCPYDLEDMTMDTVGLLDHLAIARIHVVGMSMGGMIAQTLTAKYPLRVTSLTSIFSTTGARKVGQPASSTLMRLARRAPRTREQAVASYVSLMRHIGSSRYSMPDAELRLYAGNAWDRGNGSKDSAGVARQIGAILKSGDRTTQLQDIHAPALVIHGDQDRMVAHSGAEACVQAIQGARLITIPGMGHYISDEVSPYLTDLISGHAIRSSEQDNKTGFTRGSLI